MTTMCKLQVKQKLEKHEMSARILENQQMQLEEREKNLEENQRRYDESNKSKDHAIELLEMDKVVMSSKPLSTRLLQNLGHRSQ